MSDMKKVISTTSAPAAIGPYSQAVEAAKKESRPDDLIFVGGSTFIVADLLKTMLSQQ